MPIPVICPGCRAQFTVSDQFAGRTGPCPKCKQPITVPKAVVKAVTIHEPEPAVAGSSASGGPPLAPLKRADATVTATALVATAAGAVVTMLLAWVTRAAFAPSAPPDWLLAVAGFLVAVPCAALGYVGVRDPELEAYRGRALLGRTLICAVAYAGLWCAKGLLPPDQTADMWRWFYLGPLLFIPGVIASMAAFDLDQGRAVAHFSLYAMFTCLLRWIVGLPPV